MNSEERGTNNGQHGQNEHGHGDGSMMAMMGMMMAMCLGIVLLFSVVPTVGIVIALGGGVLIVLLHNPFMGHSGH